MDGIESDTLISKREGLGMAGQIGKPAPDFSAEAYHQGIIKTIHLADYRGIWVVLFFYPADFTYV